MATGNIFDLCYTKVGNGGSFGVSRYRYTKSRQRVDNITDWALAQFRGHYSVSPLVGKESALAVEGNQSAADERLSLSAADATGPSPRSLRESPSPARGEGRITKDAIFAYVYAVLHDPLYREKYALNLKREFPRIPFYPDFELWAAWGRELLALHIGYEAATAFALARTDTPSLKRAEGTHPKPKLKSIPESGTVVVDEDTQLGGIPIEAWAYRLGNRSAIDWVLDQHKEKTPRDPTIREKFNTYRFADYKESMIVLLAKVVTVSVETVRITEAMRAVARDG